MPTSYSVFKPEIKQWFLENVPLSKRILDVGPGEGTYSNLLRSEGYRIDAIEIYEPYIGQYNLRDKYDNVYVGDIRKFDISDYDFIILGDVLEHITVGEAQQLINKIEHYQKHCMVAVPYMMPQGEYEGNIHEAHQQEDLTHDVMKERYPALECLYRNQFYGYYSIIDKRFEKAFVLYATESYAETVQGAVDSIRAFSNLPIYVYMLDSDRKIDNAQAIKWECNVSNLKQGQFIDRTDSRLYEMMIQRPQIVKDALTYLAKTVAYVDADSVATPNVERIFEMAKDIKEVPYFTRGIYDFLISNGRGGTEPNKHLESPACKLFGVGEEYRGFYRQTGYFVANHNHIQFLDEWSWMCNHPEILKNPQWYAPFHEETILNVLLWKHRIKESLPLLYMNIRLDNFDTALSNPKWGEETSMWVKYPKQEDLLFLHGEKSYDNMMKMSGMLAPAVKADILDQIEGPSANMRVLFLAPHLSTGGMPAFLLKRIESLIEYTDIDIYVVEFKNYSPDFVVQKNKIMKLVKNFWTLEDDKMELIKIIKQNQIDVVHVDEMVEGFDDFNKMPDDLMKALYAPDRTWRMVETCHNIVFNPDKSKRVHPDAYALCTPFHLETFKNMHSLKKVITFPIDNKVPTLAKKMKAQNSLGFDPKKINVLNVGLWTPGKNQGEGIEIARRYPELVFHFVGNQAGNFRHYWEPLMQDVPDNVVIWHERQDVHTFLTAADIFMFNSTWECNPLALREAISYGLPIISRNLPQYVGMFDEYIQPMDTNLYSIERNYELPVDNESIDFAMTHKDLYSQISKMNVTNKPVVAVPLKAIDPGKLHIVRYYVEQPFFEIKDGNPDATYQVKFYDDRNICIHQQEAVVGTWIKLNRKWFTRWRTEVLHNDKVIYNETLNYTGARVFIVFDSSALGDSIAWIPYCREFKEKHQCTVLVCTHHNQLFKAAYPDLEFVSPGTPVQNIMGMYHIGSHNDFNRDNEPENTVSIPLQKAACNVLGLTYEEIVADVAFKTMKRMYKNKYVAIATNSTAGCKFWQKEDWQRVIDYLVENGYQVINVSKEKNDFKNCTQILNDSMNNTMNVIHYSEFYIGLSSGLSWLAWALKKQVVMISNFTSREYEFDCIRLANESVCHACFNNPNFKFDRGNWNWCPVHEGTGRQWECQKSITSDMVIEEIKELLQ